MGERLGIAPVLAHVGLLLTSDMIGIGSLGTGMHVDDHDFGLGFRLLDQNPGPRKIEQVVGVRVGGEIDKGHLRRSLSHQSDLPGQAGLNDSSPLQRGGRISDALCTEVVRVVVRTIDNRETGRFQDWRECGRVQEGEAIRRSGTTL
jgi:hypothetical protein